MRVKLGTLKRIIREVAISPSVYENNDVVSDPFDRPSIARSVANLADPFRRGIEMNMIVASRDSYDAETHELDDAEHQRIKDASETASEMMMSRVNRVIQNVWNEAMKGVDKQS